jgi:hypothetical protein
MIKDRPIQFQSISEYRGFRLRPFSFDWSPLPDLLKYDLVSLVGFGPITKEYAAAVDDRSFDVPSATEVDYLTSIDAKIQLVQKVINVCHVSTDANKTMLLPYSVSLFPASKRGTPSTISSTKVAQIASLAFEENIYYGYNPFEESYGLYGAAGLFLKNGMFDIETDMIGFIDGAFFLVIDFADQEHLVPRFFKSEVLNARFQRFRKNRYFRPFHSVTPRRIWGADSSAELFLLQAFAVQGLSPQMQMLVYEDGTLMPSLYHVYEDETEIEDNRLLTEIDFFFPEDRFAVFCDSKYHRGRRNRAKDAEIDKRLQQMRITTCRVEAKAIMSDPFAVVQTVVDRRSG